MLDAFRDAGPIAQALIATIGTYLLTAIGTLPVLFFKSAPRRLMDAMMGFAAGVMVAASCWSLLVPSIEAGGVFTAAFALIAGAAFIYAADQLLRIFMPNSPKKPRPKAPGSPGDNRRC
jgi:ZIP family zinc transporter